MNTTIKETTSGPDQALPSWLHGCPLVFGWCRYNGRVYFADLNFDESEKAQKPIFDLAYCATKAMNGIYLMRREWDIKKFSRWGKMPYAKASVAKVETHTNDN